jgi:putative transposase
MIYPLVRDLAATGTRVRVPVAVACRVLGFSPQGFYAWLKAPVTDRDWSDAHLINAALVVHAEDPAYGYRFISDELPGLGITASERRVWRLCSQQRIWSTFSKKRGLYRKAGPPVHDDRVKRNFTATRLNQLWLTDITEHWTGEGKLYLCAIKDVRSNKIVGYSIDDRMKASLAVTALSYAVKARAHQGTIVHSDRGSQGGFNRSSQHLDGGGVRWGVARSGCRRRRRVCGGSGPRIGRCVRRCVRQAGPSLRVQCSGSFGASSRRA